MLTSIPAPLPRALSPSPCVAPSCHPSPSPRRRPCIPRAAAAPPPHAHRRPPSVAPSCHHSPSPRRRPCSPRAAAAPPPRVLRRPPRTVLSFHHRSSPRRWPHALVSSRKFLDRHFSTRGKVMFYFGGLLRQPGILFEWVGRRY